MSNGNVAVAYPSFFGGLGSAFSMMLTALGASIGISYCGTSIASAGTIRPDGLVRSMIPVVMASIVSIYGLIVSVLITRNIDINPKNSLTARQGYMSLGAGLSTGLCGIAGGYAIGCIGYVAVIANTKQPKIFVGMVIITIFAEIIAVFGLIVGLLLVV